MVQKPYGTNYAGWEHPLTPHYRQKAGAELLSVHPRAGTFGYRNWLGVVLPKRRADDTARRAAMVEAWGARGGGRRAELIVAGWAMDNMKPRDFTFSRAPLLDLPDEAAERAEGLVEAAGQVAGALRGALAPVLAEGEAREAMREAFFHETQGPFEARLAALMATGADMQAVAEGWRNDLRAAALALFDRHALPGLAELDIRKQQAVVKARQGLGLMLAGYGKAGRAAWEALGLTPPKQKKGTAA